MKHFLNRILCFLQGHPCVPTGRRGVLLIEHRCQRCDRLYISNPDFRNPDELIPYDDEFEEILSGRIYKP